MKNIKVISSLLLAILIMTLVSCSNNGSNTNNTSSNPTTKEEYANYLEERYNYYFGDSSIYNNYDIYEEDFTFNGTTEEFITAYDDSYINLKSDLESFKADLKNFVKSGTPEVDKLNAEVITDIDKAIVSVDDYNAGVAEKTKDYATLAKDEVIKGFRNIGKASHDAMDNLENLVDNAKDRLGID